MSVGDGTTTEELIDFVNGSGLGTIGTPDDACGQIEWLIEQSNGGFGCYLQLAHDWAPRQAKLRSYELFARCVAPRFQGQAQPTLDAKARARAERERLAASNLAAVDAANEKYRAELAARR